MIYLFNSVKKYISLLYARARENIGKMPTGNVLGIGYVSDNADSIAKAQVESWMDSSGHRENILKPNYDRLGVGVGYDGTYYVSTQNFW